MNDDHKHLQSAFDAVPETPAIIVRELRAMAMAEGEYHRFAYLSARIKNIWRAAADLIEDFSVKH